MHIVQIAHVARCTTQRMVTRVTWHVPNVEVSHIRAADVETQTSHKANFVPFSFSPKPQVHHSTTQQVGHISKTHYKQHSFGAQGSAEQLCLWELALFLPTLVIISLQCPLHQYSARELEHCSSFIWIVSYCFVSSEEPAEQCFRHAAYSSSINKSSFNILKMTRLCRRQIFMGEPKWREPNWLGIKSSSLSLQIYSWLTLSTFIGRQLTIDNQQNPTKIETLSTAANLLSLDL